MTITEIFQEIQKLHPNWLSFTYYRTETDTSLTFNQYNVEASTPYRNNIWSGRENCIDEPTKRLIERMKELI